MTLDWDKLRIFHAVAEAGSFTHAGNALNLSQSAISRQVSTLEESIGVSLFHRHARGLLLTEQGELLFQTSSDIFGKMAQVQRQLVDSKGLPEGPLTITMPNFIGSTWLAPKLNDFQKANPGIKITLLFDNRVFNLSMREADAAIRLYEPNQQDLIQRQLTTLNFSLCGSKDYIAEYGRPESVKELKNHTLLGHPKNCIAPFPDPAWIFKVAGIDENDPRYKTICINSVFGIAQAASAGAGIAALPDYLINADSNLEVIPFEKNRPPVDMFFVYSEEHKNSKRLARLRDFLLDNINQNTFS